MTVFEFDGGKKLQLAFTLGAWEKMENEVCALDDLFDMYKAENTKKRMSVEAMRNTIKVAVIFAEAAGNHITYDELYSAFKPGNVFVLQGAIMAAVNEGLDFENKPQKRDLVLEELDAESGKNG